MEKSEKDCQGSGLDDSPDLHAVQEMVDEPQMQEASDSQMQDDQRADEVREETRNETSVILEDNANNESGQNLQSKDEQCEKSEQNVPDELSGSKGMELETPGSECQKQGTIQTTAQMADDAATEQIPERIEEQRNVPAEEKDLEVGGDLEQCEKPEQELQVQQVEQAVELVLQEALISDARQERMEEAEDIEEPQKYAFREKDSD